MGAKKGAPSNNPNGRPAIVIDIEVMKRAASIGCNNEEIAALLGIGRATFYLHLERDPALQETLNEAAASGKATLRRLQWQRAASGDSTMLIWLGKNMLGQRDKHELTGADGGPISYVVRAPTPVESADEWLRLHAPTNQPTDLMVLEAQVIPDLPDKPPSR